MPEGDHLTLRALLLVVALSGCAHTAPLPNLLESAASLPRQTVGPVAWRPDLMRGKVVLVTFIASWCFPCLADLSVLEEMQRKHAKEGFQAVLVGMDLDGVKVLQPFVDAQPMTLPLIVADDRVRAGETPFGFIRELPTRFLFNREGELVLGYAGVADPQDLRVVIERELKR